MEQVGQHPCVRKSVGVFQSVYKLINWRGVAKRREGAIKRGGTTLATAAHRVRWRAGKRRRTADTRGPNPGQRAPTAVAEVARRCSRTAQYTVRGQQPPLQPGQAVVNRFFQGRLTEAGNVLDCAESP
jgi:hypothetical protein